MPEGARGFLDAIPALRNRECIVCGEGVAIPIRVRFDDLEREAPGLVRPALLESVARDRRRRRESSSARSSAGEGTADKVADRLTINGREAYTNIGYTLAGWVASDLLGPEG